MSVVIGGPTKHEKDERPAFYVHKDLLCYLTIKPDGVHVEGKSKDGDLLFSKPFSNSGVAMAYIEALKEKWDGNGKSESGGGSKDRD